ncbi:Cytochrome P450 [Sesbania bispinosa]|nr:Cytochrome P450 [Sesbania bispinosa]
MAPLLYYSLLSLAFILTFKLLLQKRRFKNLPPSPPSLPIIGNLYQLKPPLHRSLHTLSQKYGHIFSLRFGSRLAVAISSPALAHECFTKYDTVLANRPRALTGKHLFYNYTSLDSAPYGDHWRNLRRIITIDVLSTQRLNSFIETRRDESRRFIRKLAQDTCEGFTRVELRSRLTEMIFNNMMRMISGKEVEETEEFREVMAEMLPLFDASNKADFLPMLQWFDFDGLVKRMRED